jgi:hypothetical protein
LLGGDSILGDRLYSKNILPSIYFFVPYIRSTVDSIDGVVERDQCETEYWYCSVDRIDQGEGKQHHHCEAGPGSPRK